MATVLHTKCFKKYGDELRLDVVNAARSWAQARPELLAVYEDASLIKITGVQAHVDEMVTYLRGRFGTPLPGESSGKDDKAEKD